MQQMEERLKLFIESNAEIPATEEADGILCFVHRQIITLAQDCLDKSQSQLLSALYFHELSESLKTLSMDVSNP